MARLPIPIKGPFLGLYEDRPAHQIPRGGLSVAKHVRSRKNAMVLQPGPGYVKMQTLALPDPIIHFHNFIQGGTTSILVGFSRRDIWKWDEGTDAWVPITPQFTGFNLTTTAASTAWTTDVDITALTPAAKVGDFMKVTARPDSEYREIATIDGPGTSGTFTANAANSDTAQPGTGRSTFTGNVQQKWQAITYSSLSDLMIATNGTDTPIKWDGVAATVSDLGGSPPTAKYLAPIAERVVFANTSADPQGIHWSELGVPENYVIPASPTGNDPGKQAFPEGGDIINGILAFGPFAAIYKGATPNLLEFVGGSQIISRRQVPSDASLFFPYLLAVTERFHAFIADDQAWIFDGSTPKDIGDPIQPTIRSIFREKAPQGFALNDPVNEEIWFCLPTGSNSDGTPDTNLIWNYGDARRTGIRNSGWYKDEEFDFTAAGIYERNIARTWAQKTTDGTTWGADAEPWNLSALRQRVVVATADGLTHFFGEVYGRDGFAIDRRFDDREQDFGNPTSRKVLYAVRPLMKNINSTIQMGVFVGHRKEFMDNVTFSPTTNFKMDGTQEGAIHTRIGNRLFRTQFTLRDATLVWEVEGWIYDVGRLQQPVGQQAAPSLQFGTPPPSGLAPSPPLDIGI